MGEEGGGEWTVRHTAVDFELLSSFTELGLCVCVYMYIYNLGLGLNVSHPGAGRKNLYSLSLFCNKMGKRAIVRPSPPPRVTNKILQSNSYSIPHKLFHIKCRLLKITNKKQCCA